MSEALQKAITAFDDFLNEPPDYEDRYRVRDYRHSAYAKWSDLRNQITAALSPPDPTESHPRWKPSDKSDRHPQSVEEWDPSKDPVGEALDRARRRLNVAGDYDDPRAPPQMALVLRGDITRLMHDWIHKNAVFEIWVKEREDARALSLQDHGWQDISTAPTGDDDFYLVCCNDPADDRSPFVVRGSIFASARKHAPAHHLSMAYLTHWRPLPAKPAAMVAEQGTEAKS